MEQELLSAKRFIDLSRQADRKGIVTFSDFLTLNELNIFHQNEKFLASNFDISGGYDCAERQMVAFLPDALYYEWDYPITCLEIKPAYPKFSDTLNHRDILGAVMNLGIERSKVGDILLKDNTTYLFCCEGIADFICSELEKVKHTIVSIQKVDAPAMNIQPNFEHLSGIISSNRLDNIIACICHTSRSEATSFIGNGKVFINGKEILHNTYICKSGDVISVRTYGKYIFDTISGETKKGRIKINYRKYQ